MESIFFKPSPLLAAVYHKSALSVPYVLFVLWCPSAGRPSFTSLVRNFIVPPMALDVRVPTTFARFFGAGVVAVGVGMVMVGTRPTAESLLTRASRCTLRARMRSEERRGGKEG